MSKERPILFNGDMVRAILSGRKTQTRRIVNPQPRIIAGELFCWKENALTPEQIIELCPFGQPGDRLWVRESWYQRGKWMIPDWPEADAEDSYWSGTNQIAYAVDAKRPGHDWRTRPSIHMPRWASRILLEVVSVRVERLNDISEADAIAEGVKNSLHLHGGRFAKENFAHLWWTINGDGSWEANPWVFVVEFRRVEQ